MTGQPGADPPVSDERVRCRACRKPTDTDPCWRCTRTCSRKKRYATYNQAKEARTRMAPKLWDDPTLHVYRCQAAASGEHFHIGHATGQQGRRMAKRAEKFRRKALVQETWEPEIDGALVGGAAADRRG